MPKRRRIIATMMLSTPWAHASAHLVLLGDALKRSLTFTGRFALTGVAAAALLLAAPAAWSLGLGRIQVQSALGESLRAEIDVTSMTPEEASNLRVRVAPPESYKAAGVDYNAVLPSTQVELQRRADGRPYLKLTSDRGVQEPFVDVILEINWSNSIVYSRTRRPVDQLISRITSTKGSWTPRSLVSLR